MIFIYKCTTFLVLMVKISSCYNNDCPSFHTLNNGSISASIVVYTPNNHNNEFTLEVQLSIGSYVSDKEFKDKLIFLGDDHDMLVYKLELPSHLNNSQTKITKISINKEHICSSNSLNNTDFINISTINVSITAPITTGHETLSHTLPPNSYNINPHNNDWIQPPLHRSIRNSPNSVVNQPINQNFQTSNCYGASQVRHLIHNGDPALIEEFPWIGALFTYRKSIKTFQCGATLITAKLALTAGHCVVGNIGKVLVLIFGTADIENVNFNVKAQSSKVIRHMVHPEYNQETSDADIAILILSKVLVFTDTVRPICLFSLEDPSKNIPNQKGVVTGWGQDENDKMSTTLKQSNAGIVLEETCLWSDARVASITSDRTFCAGGRNGAGPCKGDSGSGFYMFIDGRWTIRGIVSRALGTSERGCDLFQYVIYVDVAKHLDWILPQLQ